MGLELHCTLSAPLSYHQKGEGKKKKKKKKKKPTHANSVSQLTLDVQNLIRGHISLLDKGAIVRSHHGDVGVFPRAELRIAIARLGVDGSGSRRRTRRARSIGRGIANDRGLHATHEHRQGVGGGGGIGTIASTRFSRHG